MLEASASELKDEAGLIDESFEIIGRLFEAYGFSNQGFTVYLATQLTLGESNLEVTETGMVRRRFELEEIWNLIDCGVMRDAPSIAALALVSRHLAQA